MFKNLIILSLFLASCHKIDHGKIYYIGFEPPHYQSYTYYVPMGKAIIPMQRQEWISDTAWFICFNNGKKEREIYVSKEDAIKYNIGDSVYLTKQPPLTDIIMANKYQYTINADNIKSLEDVIEIFKHFQMSLLLDEKKIRMSWIGLRYY